MTTTTIAFTGTQRGMTKLQRLTVIQLIGAVAQGECIAIHGDCIGADRDFHEIARHYGIPVETYPGTDGNGESPKRAHCPASVVHDPAPYLERNQQMVDRSQIVIACPGESVEQVRSGTWSTVRRARKAGRTVYLVRPDGTLV